MTKQKIEKLIIDSLDEIQDFYDPSTLVIDSNTVLFGQGGMLDSMALVALIVELEAKIEEAFNVCIVLANDNAVSVDKNPFKTISSFVEYIDTLIKGKKDEE